MFRMFRRLRARIAAWLTEFLDYRAPLDPDWADPTSQLDDLDRPPGEIGDVPTLRSISTRKWV